MKKTNEYTDYLVTCEGVCEHGCFDYENTEREFDTKEEAEKFAQEVKEEADRYFGNYADIDYDEDTKTFHVDIDTHDHWSDMFYISESGHVTPRDI